jgi:hypothetical protein
MSKRRTIGKAKKVNNPTSSSWDQEAVVKAIVVIPPKQLASPLCFQIGFAATASATLDSLISAREKIDKPLNRFASSAAGGCIFATKG